MQPSRTRTAALLALLAPCGLAQTTAAPAPQDRQPLYRVTIVSRTTKALNYGHLTTPTRIGFAGTPLATSASGEATIEPARGATQIRSRFDDLPAPQTFGAQYLTYVVWAISPDGRAQNLGELMLDASNDAKLTTSTPLQTFALIVTAEPYYSVTQPSEVVVMENVVVPGTVGKVQEVNATYELLPRKEFTWDSAKQRVPPGKPVSKDEYDALVAIYQAQNAIQIAESQNAQRHAPERLARARQLYDQARAYPMSLSKEIVAIAKEATQVAEDSRIIAGKRAEAERAAAERAATEAEQRALEARRRAEAEQRAQELRAEEKRAEEKAAEAQRSRIESPRSAAPTPQAQFQNAPAATDRPPIEVDTRQFSHGNPAASENRGRLLAALRSAFPAATDTPRGIVITLPESAASNPSLATALTRLAAAIRPYRDLHIEVGGHTDSAHDTAGTQRRADMVRNALIAASVPAGMIVARGYGNTRPVTSGNNRRVEIAIAGDSIGSVPTWGRTYTITPTQSRR